MRSKTNLIFAAAKDLFLKTCIPNQSNSIQASCISFVQVALKRQQASEDAIALGLRFASATYDGRYIPSSYFRKSLKQVSSNYDETLSSRANYREKCGKELASATVLGKKYSIRKNGFCFLGLLKNKHKTCAAAKTISRDIGLKCKKISKNYGQFFLQNKSRVTAIFLNFKSFVCNFLPF